MSTCKLVIQDEINIKLENLPVSTRRKLSNALKFELPYARHIPSVKLGRWDGATRFFGIGGTGYINHLDIIMELLAEDGIEISEIEDNRKSHTFKFERINLNYWADQGKVWPTGHRFAGEPIVLRDYQLEAINIFMDNIQGVQELCTGAGKTLITATLSKLCEPYGRTVVIVPNKSLVVQTEKDYINVGLDVGVYFGDRKETGRTHTITTWQSLNVLDKKGYEQEAYNLTVFLQDMACVIVDEAHGAKGEILRKILSNNCADIPIRWGLTGTIPKEKANFHCLLSAIGPIVNKITACELQEQGVLSNCHVNIIQLLDFKEFKTYKDELKYLVTNAERIDYIADICNEIRKSGNLLILVDRISTGKHIQSIIPNSVFVSGSTKLNDRKEQYDEMDMQGMDDKVLLATYGIASIGINVVNIHNIVLIEPGKSFVRVIQSIGRGLRKGQEKDHVEIYDITSNCKYSSRHLTERKKFYKEAKYAFDIKKIDWQ